MLFNNLRLVTQRHIIFALLALTHLIVGLNIYKDYGISWDEFENRKYASIEHHLGKPVDYYKHLTDGDTHAATRGPIFLNFLTLFESEKLNLQEVYHQRHLLTFLLYFFACISFYLLNYNVYKSRLIAIFSYLMLALMPRIFAHSFYNPIDIPLLSFFIFSFLSLYWYGQKKSYSVLFIHACITGALCSIRLPGESLLFFTIIYICFFEANTTKQKLIRTLIMLTTTVAVMIAAWPYLWSSPFSRLFEVHAIIPQYRPIILSEVFLGTVMQSHQMPWFYHLVWISITTPLLYTLLFLFSLPFSILECLKALRRKEFLIKHLLLAGMISIIAMALLLASAAKFIKYNEWRHFYFLYPLMVFIGLNLLQRVSRSHFKTTLFCSTVYFLFISYKIFEYHPHQNVYFNEVITDRKNLHKIFPLDYWGGSYKQALDFLSKYDNRETIKISVNAYRPAISNLSMLPKDERSRFFIVDSKDEAHYFLTNWTYKPYLSQDNLGDYPLIYSNVVSGMSIFQIYKLSN